MLSFESAARENCFSSTSALTHSEFLPTFFNKGETLTFSTTRTEDTRDQLLLLCLQGLLRVLKKEIALA